VDLVDVLWSMFIFLLDHLHRDLRQDLQGHLPQERHTRLGKAGWFIFLIFIPLIGPLCTWPEAKMTEQDSARWKRSSSSSAASRVLAAEEIARAQAAERLGRHHEEEFQDLKRKA